MGEGQRRQQCWYLEAREGGGGGVCGGTEPREGGARAGLHEYCAGGGWGGVSWGTELQEPVPVGPGRREAGMCGVGQGWLAGWRPEVGSGGSGAGPAGRAELVIRVPFGAVVQLCGLALFLPPCPRPSLYLATLGYTVQTCL